MNVAYFNRGNTIDLQGICPVVTRINRDDVVFFNSELITLVAFADTYKKFTI